jgi:hypothetical protein
MLPAQRFVNMHLLRGVAVRAKSRPVHSKLFGWWIRRRYESHRPNACSNRTDVRSAHSRAVSVQKRMNEGTHIYIYVLLLKKRTERRVYLPFAQQDKCTRAMCLQLHAQLDRDFTTFAKPVMFERVSNTFRFISKK